MARVERSAFAARKKDRSKALRASFGGYSRFPLHFGLWHQAIIALYTAVMALMLLIECELSTASYSKYRNIKVDLVARLWRLTPTVMFVH